MDRENRIMFTTLNQSAFSPNSQVGGTLNAIRKKVPMKIVLAKDMIIVNLSFI